MAARASAALPASRSIVMTRATIPIGSNTSLAASKPTYDLPAAASTITRGARLENRRVARSISSSMADTSIAFFRSSSLRPAPSASM